MVNQGPGDFFASHPALYTLSVVGAAVAGAAMAARAIRGRGLARLGWAALAVLEVGIVTGIVSAKRGSVQPYRG